jgi:hypothetical protein
LKGFSFRKAFSFSLPAPGMQHAPPSPLIGFDLDKNPVQL